MSTAVTAMHDLPTERPSHQQAESARRAAAERPLPEHAHVVVIGTGFAGLGMAVKMIENGTRDFLLVERADNVGGTWRDNTYPGAACDVPSQLYSFSFALKPDWSRSFSEQPEIQGYLENVTSERDLWQHIRLNVEVTGSTWDEATSRWCLDTNRGPITADIVVSAVGALSEPSIPKLPGLEKFAGTVFHSARWDHSHDFNAEEKVAVVGTGASAIQFVPEIQPKVGSMTVFQRTPPWIIPRHDRALTETEKKVYQRFPRLQKVARGLIYGGRETYALAFTRYLGLLKLPELVARRHIEKHVPDPELRKKVTPDYTIGCKRILISNDWYKALSKPNVHVETSGIAEIREHSIVTKDGTEHQVDTILFGTGFSPTEMPIAKWLRGTSGKLLSDTWAETMSSYLGSTVTGYPNFFFVVGPNTGLGHTSQVYMIESQVAYVADAIKTFDDRGLATVEPRAEAEKAFDAEVQQRMSNTVWVAGGCKSWYVDANGRNTTLWPDFTFQFRRRLRKFDPENYHLRTRQEVAGGRAKPQEPTAVTSGVTA
ncbi:MAG TPA: NAD(P)/FAD-dependent oxidoreductase [Frankiaceae bacterium]|nr:NAD(P)/FAD-dependent oxidoreductase [Frankiaceae bacterium]